MKNKPNTSLERPDLFEQIFLQASINSIIILDEHGFVLKINEAFSTTFGYNEEDIIGKHFRMLFTEHDQKAQRPEMELIMVKKQGFAPDENYTINKKGYAIWVSGESIWVESSEYGNCIVKIIQNIHAQKLQEKFLSEANEFSHAIIENMEDALLIVRADLMILKANQAFYRLFGLTPSTLEGNYVPDLEKTLSIFFDLEHLIEDITENEQLVRELEWTIPAGQKRVLQMRGKQIFQENSEDKRLLLLFHDITMQKAAEQQREDLINFVSHELRNPMANLALVLELLPESIKNNHTAEVDEYMKTATANLKRLKQVIEELYDSTRAATGHLSVHKAGFQLPDMVSEAVGTVKLMSPGYEIDYSDMPDIRLHADRFRLIQVLNNYLTNAIKYADGSKRIDVDASVADNMLVMSVTDYGPGIPEDQLPHVFNKYYRGQSSARMDGLGLGLYVCKEIISAHGGQVWATTEPGKGSTFFFSIPV